MRELTLTGELLDPILARNPAGPRVTWYDDGTGARIELSAVTLANWAAKTANLIRDEFGLAPGARLAVLLPAHWQTTAVLLGAWWAGAEVTLEPDPDVEAAFVAADRLPEVADTPEVAVLSLDALGGSVRDLPAGVTDFATAVRVHGDRFTPSGAGAALAGAAVGTVLDRARATAAALGIGPDDRVLSTAEWDSAAALIDGFVAVLAAGASLVQVSNPDPAAQQRRIGSERITLCR
ncbi:TIGR03089 family protein [Skermania piniformis]|uniref:TIGR03089 family protein n=1 Tax=Skermania pinensis TaxID=39122 RepID=A0ABX8S8F4_9ACTN|nr:TIGR03089 family protein [Skermania piniformis]QXQ13279.1 TIGR03089 family protein [Skermania piniformis]